MAYDLVRSLAFRRVLFRSPSQTKGFGTARTWDRYIPAVLWDWPRPAQQPNVDIGVLTLGVIASRSEEWRVGEEGPLHRSCVVLLDTRGLTFISGYCCLVL